MNIIKETTPIARKEHTCYYCGGIIKVGEKYERATLKTNHIYDWVSHCHCSELVNMIDMYRMCEADGIEADYFQDCIDYYIHENHYDDSIDDTAKEWVLPFPELCEKIYQELKEKGE